MIVPLPPPKVLAYVRREAQQWRDATELWEYLRRNERTSIGNPALISYMIGCDYNTARSISRWLSHAPAEPNQ